MTPAKWYRPRHFTDSGVIGSKEFVSRTYMRFKHHFISKNEKKTKTCKGIIWRLFFKATF
jgi:hypothetical protein